MPKLNEIINRMPEKCRDCSDLLVTIDWNTHKCGECGAWSGYWAKKKKPKRK